MLQPTRTIRAKSERSREGQVRPPNEGGARGETDAEADMPSAEASGAICVQRFDGSRNSAIHTTYRISLRSSSIREPRYPLLRVVFGWSDRHRGAAAIGFSVVWGLEWVGLDTNYRRLISKNSFGGAPAGPETAARRPRPGDRRPPKGPAGQKPVVGPRGGGDVWLPGWIRSIQ